MWHYSKGRSTYCCSGEHPVSPGPNTRLARHHRPFLQQRPGSGGGTPRPPPRPGPAARGARGERGGRRVAPRRWAAARDELSGPAGCCRQVASDAARGRRPRRWPRGAFPASRPPQAGPGLLGPARQPGERPAPPRPPPLPSARPPAASLPAPPARPPPGGLHSERPRAARRDGPRPRSPRVSEEERRLRNRQPPPVPPPPPPASPPRPGRARRRRRRHGQ